MKRILSLILAMLMVMALLTPAYASGSPAEPSSGTVTWINPIYADVITEADIPKAEEPEDLPAAAAAAGTVKAAGAMIREKMVTHTETVTVSTNFYVYSSYIHDIVVQAVEHTGKGNEGDYILYHLGGYSASWSSYYVTYKFLWYTTPAQERTVDSRISSLVTELGLKNKTDYGKVKAIYEYITRTVRYDYSHSSSYKLKYTAYAALVNHLAVCQGYATLFYRMCLTAGVSARVITGIGNGGPHAWNIAKVGTKYYYADSTWDENRTESRWNWFLLGSNYFYDHQAIDLNSPSYRDYSSSSFRSSFPISSTNYSGSTVESTGGWRTDAKGYKYYYSNGKPVTGYWLIDGKNYYFSSADGHMLTGLVNTGSGKLRYFDPKDGHMLTGLVTTGGKTYYFSASTNKTQRGVMLTGLVNTGNGQKRYFSASAKTKGQMLTGLVNTGSGMLRYFDPDDGHMLTGVVQTPTGTRYFSTLDGHLMKNGWVSGPGGVQYLLDSSGYVVGARY